MHKTKEALKVKGRRSLKRTKWEKGAAEEEPPENVGGTQYRSMLGTLMRLDHTVVRHATRRRGNHAQDSDKQEQKLGDQHPMVSPQVVKIRYIEREELETAGMLKARTDSVAAHRNKLTSALHPGVASLRPVVALFV